MMRFCEFAKSFIFILLLFVSPVNSSKDDYITSVESKESPSIVEAPLDNQEKQSIERNVKIDLNPQQKTQGNENHAVYLMDDMIKDDIDMGLRPRIATNKLQDEIPSSKLSDADIKDDLDLGLKPNKGDSNSDDNDSNSGMKLDVENGNFENKYTTRSHLNNREIKNDIDLGLNPRHDHYDQITARPLSDIDVKNDIDMGLKPTRDFHDTTRGPLSYIDVKNDIDMGLKPSHDLHDTARGPLSDIDFKNDIDMGLKPSRDQHDTTRGPLSDIDFKNDIDMGLKSSRDFHDTTRGPLSDIDFKNDIDMGLKPSRDLHYSTRSPLSDIDFKNDIDMGLKPSRYLHDTTRGPLSYIDFKNDVDMGLKPSHDLHDTTRGPLSDIDVKNDIDMGLKPSREPHDKTRGPLSDKDIKNNIDMGLKPKRSNNDIAISRKNAIIKLLHDRRVIRKDLLEKNYEIRGDTSGQEQENHHLKENRIIPNRPNLPEKDELHLRIHEKTAKPSNLDNQPNTARNEEQEKGGISFIVKNTTDICDQYDVNGCSIPFGAPFFFKPLFTKSCYRHDVCYHCGVKYAIDRKECDETFKANMWKSCLVKYGDGKSITEHPYMRKVIKAVESLEDAFKDQLEHLLGPALVPSGDGMRDVELLNMIAKKFEERVILKWVVLLAQQLKKDMPKKLKKYRSIGSLNYNNDELEVVKNEKHVKTKVPNKSDASLCDTAIMIIRENKETRRVELGCPELELLSCHYFDFVYYFAVRVFGASSYHEQPEFYCAEPFVKQCLPKH